MKDLAYSINIVKSEIDRYKHLLDNKAAERIASPITLNNNATGVYNVDADGDGVVDVIDEEEFTYLNEMKAQKCKYRQMFEQLKEYKSNAEFIERSVEMLRQRLLDNFTVWYDSTHGSHDNNVMPVIMTTLDSTGSMVCNMRAIFLIAG